MMIDVLAGLKTAGDRPFAGGVEAREGGPESARTGDQPKINKTEHGVNNHAAEEDRNKESSRDDSFDAAVSTVAEEKSAKKAPPSIAREMHSAFGALHGALAAALDAADRAGGNGDGAAKSFEPVEGGEGLTLMAPDKWIKASDAGQNWFAGFSEAMLGGRIQVASASLRENATDAGEAARAPVGPLAGASLIGSFSGRWPGLITLPEPHSSSPGANEAAIMAQKAPTASAQKVQQRFDALAALPGVLANADGAPVLSGGAIEIFDVEGGLLDQGRFRLTKPLQQLNINAGSAATPAGIGAIVLAPSPQISALGDFKAVTEMGPVEFGAAKTYEAFVQTTGSVHQAATPTPAVTAQIIAAFRADRIGNSVEVRLDPPELGRVRIDFAVETAEAVRAVVTAERAETLDYLRRNAAHLANELRAAGFSNVDLEFANREQTTFSADSKEAAIDIDGEPILAQQSENMIYLTMRDNARLDMLV